MQRAGISQRHIGRQVCRLFIGKSARPAAGPTPPAGGRIEHQIEELRHQLEAPFCAPVASSPSSWVSALPSAALGKTAEIGKARRNAVALRIALSMPLSDILLVLAEPGGAVSSA